LYDDDFKHNVIKEYLAGSSTKKHVTLKYGIGGKSAILTWMRELGYKNSDSIRKSARFRKPLIDISMPADDENKTDLLKQIKDLKRKLEDEQLRSEAYLRMIEKAEQELKISIKKKSDSK